MNTTITLVDPDVAFIGRGETETRSEVPLGVLLLDCKVVAAEASVLFVVHSPAMELSSGGRVKQDHQGGSIFASGIDGWKTDGYGSSIGRLM